MKIIFIGDVIGRTGREAIIKNMPKLKERYAPDAVIVNGENAAHGFGINEKQCHEFFEAGVNVITLGNHAWDQREMLGAINKMPNVIRPLNYPEGTPGHGAYDIELNDGRKLLVINVMGQLFMPMLDSPFTITRKFLSKYKLGRNRAIFIDFHGEATSEKMAFGHYFDGDVTAVVGSHTHIPTADAHIMVGGTAFQADAGMTGDYDSVIGMQKDLSIERFVKKLPTEKMKPAKNESTLCGIFIESDDKTGLATHIEPIRMGGILSQT